MQQELISFYYYLIRNQLVKHEHATICVRWLRYYLKFAVKYPGKEFEFLRPAFIEKMLHSGICSGEEAKKINEVLEVYRHQFLTRNVTELHPQIKEYEKRYKNIDEIERSRQQITELNIQNVLYSLQQAIRLKHLSLSTERSYLSWARRFLEYNQNTRNCVYPTAEHVKNFLTHLALQKSVSASTQNQAFAALLMLCNEVLQVQLDDISNSVRARKGTRLPVVLSQSEVRQILQRVAGDKQLLFSLIYGTGMRLSEALRLRVKDIDFDLNTITIRDGKGNKDRVTILPQSLVLSLQAHLKIRKQIHANDLYHHQGSVYLPKALAEKYPRAATQWAWQWVFAQSKLSMDPRSCDVRRHHITAKSAQRAFSLALKQTDIQKHASVHSLRHSFATQLLIENVDIRQIQELLGHKNLETTMIYTHVAKGIRSPVRSPVDVLSSLQGPFQNEESAPTDKELSNNNHAHFSEEK